MAAFTHSSTLGIVKLPRLKKPWPQGNLYSSKYVCNHILHLHNCNSDLKKEGETVSDGSESIWNVYVHVETAFSFLPSQHKEKAALDLLHHFL